MDNENYIDEFIIEGEIQEDTSDEGTENASDFDVAQQDFELDNQQGSENNLVDEDIAIEEIPFDGTLTEIRDDDGEDAELGVLDEIEIEPENERQSLVFDKEIMDNISEYANSSSGKQVEPVESEKAANESNLTFNTDIYSSILDSNESVAGNNEVEVESVDSNQSQSEVEDDYITPNVDEQLTDGFEEDVIDGQVLEDVEGGQVFEDVESGQSYFDYDEASLEQGVELEDTSYGQDNVFEEVADDSDLLNGPVLGEVMPDEEGEYIPEQDEIVTSGDDLYEDFEDITDQQISPQQNQEPQQVVSSAETVVVAKDNPAPQKEPENQQPAQVVIAAVQNEGTTKGQAQRTDLFDDEQSSTSKQQSGSEVSMKKEYTVDDLALATESKKGEVVPAKGEFIVAEYRITSGSNPSAVVTNRRLVIDTGCRLDVPIEKVGAVASSKVTEVKIAKLIFAILFIGICIFTLVFDFNNVIPENFGWAVYVIIAVGVIFGIIGLIMACTSIKKKFSLSIYADGLITVMSMSSQKRSAESGLLGTFVIARRGKDFVKFTGEIGALLLQIKESLQ